jgi:peptidoglycan/xylan/chitin deacetylase (PgdA/CDA1 family)
MAKRLAKLAISLWFLCLWKLVDMARLVAGRPRCGTHTILIYHGIPAEDRKRFAKQMDILRKTAVPVDLDFVAPLEPNKHYVATTFDDAFRSAFLHALPELEKRGIPSTIFVPAGYIGKKAGWIRDPLYHGFGEDVMTRAELLETHRKGVTIGSHGLLHLNLANASDEQTLSELRGSKKELEDLTGREVKLFALPHGAYNDGTLEWAREVGYQNVFSVIPSLHPEDKSTFLRGRVDASPRDWTLEFRLKLLGAYRWMEIVANLKRAARAWRKSFLSQAGPKS